MLGLSFVLTLGYWMVGFPLTFNFFKWNVATGWRFRAGKERPKSTAGGEANQGALKFLKPSGIF